MDFLSSSRVSGVSSSSIAGRSGISFRAVSVTTFGLYPAQINVGVVFTAGVDAWATLLGVVQLLWYYAHLDGHEGMVSVVVTAGEEDTGLFLKAGEDEV
ncbi:hypothetical protein CHS0354_032809 [Potamilus streckersoni]|uniref:Uncharacterized protein n=1 Tax=Potamilus streckersoni TaxID=2493646 RepID=A0AAE0S991_9BIVA|nr:hypothetical protein CHS0354_032809 [Potamilus streckersoni]